MNWNPIDELAGAPDLVLAYVPPDAQFPQGRMMIWSRDILARNIKGPTPGHLQFPATHWMHLPAPPNA